MSGIDRAARYRQSEEVAFRKIVDEVLIVPIREEPRRRYGIFRLNRTAASVWELMDGAHTVEDVVAAMVERFDVGDERARRDTLELIRDLLECGAIVKA